MMKTIWQMLLAYHGFGLLQGVLLSLAAYRLFALKYKTWKSICLLSFFTLLSWAMLPALGAQSFLLKIALSMVLHLFVWRLLFRDALGKLLFFNLVLFYEIVISKFVVASLVCLSTNEKMVTTAAFHLEPRFGTGLFSFLCATALLYATVLYFKSRPLEIPNRYWFVVDCFFFLRYSISVLMMYLNQYAPATQYFITTLVLCALFPILFVLTLKLFTDLCSLFEREKHMAVMQTMNEALQQQLSLQDKALLDIRKVHHDMKNHTLSLSALLRVGNVAAAIDYLTKLTPTIQGAQLSAYCKNSAVNGILNVKMGEACAAGCFVALSVDPDFDVELPAVDITCILANLLDNAIEAAQRLPVQQRTIKVQMGSYHALSYFRVANAYCGNLKKSEGVFLTSKPRAAMHGYGLELVKAAAQRNAGMLQINDANQTFVATVFVKRTTN